MRPGDAVRTYKARRRVTPGQAEAIARLMPRFGGHVPFPPRPSFGQLAPLVLEIGSGMGEATAAQAAADPSYDVLAAEVHTPGVGALLRRLEEAGLDNVRVLEADGLEVLRAQPPGSLEGVRVFFPDPWPKARHAKRRLVTAAFADLVAERLRPGGWLHVATDWTAYAAGVRDVLAQHPRFGPVGTSRGDRPLTRFERQGLAAGREAHDLRAATLGGGSD